MYDIPVVLSHYPSLIEAGPLTDTAGKDMLAEARPESDSTLGCLLLLFAHMVDMKMGVGLTLMHAVSCKPEEKVGQRGRACI